MGDEQLAPDTGVKVFWGERPPVPLDNRAEYAIRQIGGNSRIWNAGDDDFTWLRREFIEAWKNVPELERIEHELAGIFPVAKRCIERLASGRPMERLLPESETASVKVPAAKPGVAECAPVKPVRLNPEAAKYAPLKTAAVKPPVSSLSEADRKLIVEGQRRIEQRRMGATRLPSAAQTNSPESEDAE